MGTLTHTMAGHLAHAGAARPRVPGCPSTAGHATSGMSWLSFHGTSMAVIEGTTVKPEAIWAYDPANRFPRRRSELSP
jgi:hypothetical protein